MRMTDNNGNRKIAVICKDCGEHFMMWKHIMWRWSGRCRRCSNIESANKPEAKEARREMSRSQVIAQGGIPNAVHFDGKKGIESPRWKGGLPKCEDCGKELGSYTARWCVDCKGKHFCGEKHWNWKGGISTAEHIERCSVEYNEWRKKIHSKYGWTCQRCGKKVKDIVAHHIVGFSENKELRYSEENGIALCRSCHASIHAIKKLEARTAI